MRWLFIGPNPLAGIGQVTMKYASMLQAEYCQYGQRPSMKHYDAGFAFILPIKAQLDMLRNEYTKVCDRFMFMTVCETETVHQSYKDLLEFQPIYCPSEFSRDILKRQFPMGDWRLLRHWVPHVDIPPVPLRTTYTFYTIGNITDPRKNISMLIDAFQTLKLQDCRLLLKATCTRLVELKIPGVVILNGLMTDDQLDTIHNSGDCYVNCSFSEGVGMGAVEAAVRDKPCIIPEYGGLKEYVKTPYVISCGRQLVGMDDFLYEKNMVWGSPSMSDLRKFMTECHQLKLRTQDHSFTRTLVRSAESELPRCVL